MRGLAAGLFLVGLIVAFAAGAALEERALPVSVALMAGGLWLRVRGH